VKRCESYKQAEPDALSNSCPASIDAGGNTFAHNLGPQTLPPTGDGRAECQGAVLWSAMRCGAVALVASEHSYLPSSATRPPTGVFFLPD